MVERAPADKRPVHGAGCTGLGLHLDDLQDLAEDVLPSMGRPVVTVFPHAARRGDGIDCRDFAQGIGHVGRRFVSFNGFHLFAH